MLKPKLSCIVDNSRTSFYKHYLSVVIVSRNKCFNTAEPTQIKKNEKKCKRELSNMNLKSLYNYRYLLGYYLF